MEPDADNPSQNQVGVVFEDLRNRLWVSNNGGRLYLFDREQEAFVEKYFDSDTTSATAHNDIIDGSGGRLWLAGL